MSTSSHTPSVAAAPRTSAADADIRVERIESYRAFLDLEPEWDDLLERSETNRVFFTHVWFRCWWEAFGQEQRLAVLCARRGDRLVGVAPLHVSRSWFRGLPVRTLRFMANGYSGDCDFIVDAAVPGVAQSFFRFLASAASEWDILELGRLREASPLWRQWASIVDPSGLRYRARSGMRVPYLQIDRRWEEFLGRRSKKLRKEYRSGVNKNQRRAEPIEVVQLTTSADVISALDGVFDVSSRSWKSVEGSAITDSLAARRFFEALSRDLAGRGWVTLWLATVRGDPVAFKYHLDYRGISASIRADFDEAYREISPGAYLLAEMLRSLFERPEHDIVEYDTCGSTHGYILRWTKTTRAHVTVRVSSPGWYGRLLHWLGGVHRPRRGRYAVADPTPET